MVYADTDFFLALLKQLSQRIAHEAYRGLRESEDAYSSFGRAPEASEVDPNEDYIYVPALSLTNTASGHGPYWQNFRDLVTG